jgi:hypothetical protein
LAGGSGAICPPSWIFGKKTEIKKKEIYKISIIIIKVF